MPWNGSIVSRQRLVNSDLPLPVDCYGSCHSMFSRQKNHQSLKCRIKSLKSGIDQHAGELLAIILAINQGDASLFGPLLAARVKIIACRNDPGNFDVPIIFLHAALVRHIVAYLFYGPRIRLTVEGMKLGLNID